MMKLRQIKVFDSKPWGNSIRMLSHIALLASVSISIMNLSGCESYSDKTRQQNLCRSLSRQYTFQQMPATYLSPAQYRLCGDNCFPCRAYTGWGTPPEHYYHRPLHHRHAKHKPLQKNKLKTIPPKQSKATQGTQIKTKPEDNLLNGQIFLSPLKPSPLTSSPLRKPL